MTSLILGLVSLLAVAAPISADLGGYVERSAETEFSGEQLVSCDTPDGERDSIFEVAQTDGWVYAWAGEEESIAVGAGVLSSVDGDEVAAAAVESRELGTDSVSYRVAGEEAVTYLGRAATDVTIERDGDKRIVLTVDDMTDTVVRTQTFDASGARYCDRRLLSFEPGPVGDVAASAPVGGEPAAPIDSVPSELPDGTHGFQLLDTYQLDDGTLSYYSDGFFSFGVVVTDRPVGFDDPAAVVVVDGDHGRYRRSYVPGRVTVAWETSSGNMALIGDLPPDLVDAVLGELPRPPAAGFFERFWSRLFG